MTTRFIPRLIDIAGLLERRQTFEPGIRDTAELAARSLHVARCSATLRVYSYKVTGHSEPSFHRACAWVHVAAQDRAGLERLPRYCARPPFALERLELLDAARVVYRLPASQRDGATALTLTPQASTSILVSASLMSRPLHNGFWNASFRLVGPV